MQRTDVGPLADVLARGEGVEAAYLFGSVADGREHAGSDIDLAVRLSRSVYPTARERFEARLRLIADLQRVTARMVDLLVLNDAPPQLARAIMTTGIRLLAVDPRHELGELCLTLSRAADIEPFLRRTRAIKLRAITQ